MGEKFPSLGGVELMKLLEQDGWTKGRFTRHGASYSKTFPDGEIRVTIIPNKSQPLPEGTLRAIIGPHQTGLGRQGLIQLMEKSRKK